MNSHHLTAALTVLLSESDDLVVPQHVPSISSLPSPFTFYRHYVSTNTPVIMRGVAQHWPAMAHWSDGDYVSARLGSQPITVAVTPTGYADAVHGSRFVMPEERKMSFQSFLSLLHSDHDDKQPVEIYYIQKQNSNLKSELSCLNDDIDPCFLKWCEDVFGKSCDAQNFWMGDKRAITSLHKDPYENMYCVVKGSKTFTLIPPIHLPYVPYGMYKPAVYRMKDGGAEFEIEDIASDHVPWIPIDPLAPDYDLYPEFAKARRIQVTVNAGDVFYLPSLWFHHVQQSHACIAVNFWFDMEYDVKYVYYKFLEKLCHKNNSNESDNE